MDVLYVVGNGSKQNNLELRISLRSICKYADNLGRVIVVGKPPSWLSDEVVRLEVADKYSYKHSNILNCIEEAINRGLVRGEFLYSSDDHFYIRKVNFDAYPYYQKVRELCRAVSKSDSYYQYHSSLYDTRRMLEKYGLPADNYAQHCNTHMHTEVFKSIIDLIHESYKLPFGVEPTTVIMNAWMTRPDAPKPVIRHDVKISRAITMQDLWKQIGDRECFSVGDSVFNGAPIRNLFSTEFPNKCRFENMV